MKKGKSATVGFVFCFVVMIAIMGLVTFRNREEEPEGELAETEEKPLVLEESEEEEAQVTQGDSVQAEVETEIEEVNPVVKERTFSFTEEDVLMWPIDGDVILNYNMNETVYFATLDQYKYNPAIIISGIVGQDVVAARDGKVTSIKTDAQTGVTVTISLGNGYEAIYGQIGEVCVSEGEIVSEGDIIGWLGEPTKYYSVEGCNLYFQLLKDGEPVNPMEYLDI